MILEENQIQEILRSPKNLGTILEAMSLQRRLRFHTEVSFDGADIAVPKQDFLVKVSNILPPDKYRVIQSLYNLPNTTVEVVDTAYTELKRVCNSNDYSASYQFTDSELAEDWEMYRKNVLHDPEIWKTVGWNKMKTAPNSVLIIDLPVEQNTDRPEPYFYWLDIDDVCDYQLKDNSTTDMEWIIFNQPDDKIAVFDSKSYRVYKLGKDKQIEDKLVDNVHNLGYCPARFFWTEPLNTENPGLKKNPIAKELDSLDWLLFQQLSKRYLDTYAPYPIVGVFEQECDYQDDNGHSCHNGYMVDDETGLYLQGPDGGLLACPVCGNKRFTGPGSIIQVPVPSTTEGVANMIKPVSITSIDDKSLDFMTNEVERIKNNIIDSIVGRGGTVSEKEAINTVQVSANFANKTSVLNDLKLNFESAQKFVEETVCRLRYGKSFLSLGINWGSEFYIFTVVELYDQLKKAKETGASSAELTAIRNMITETKYRNNPLMLARMKLLKQIEPYSNKTETEIRELYNKGGLIDRDKFVIKINFEDFVNRFERENCDILEFGNKIPLSKKVEQINKEFEKYVKEQDLEIDKPIKDDKVNPPVEPKNKDTEPPQDNLGDDE